MGQEEVVPTEERAGEHVAQLVFVLLQWGCVGVGVWVCGVVWRRRRRRVGGWMHCIALL
jgi:hypothetical protein